MATVLKHGRYGDLSLKKAVWRPFFSIGGTATACTVGALA
jgi:hypothetical protein